MDVTGFYIQAGVVLDEHRRMIMALHFIAGVAEPGTNIYRSAKNALPMSETARTPNEKS
jgi:hypothetical protein